MKINLLLITLFYTFFAQASISIISDLDDTIKITEASGNPRDLFGKDVYTGMPHFFKAAKTYTDDLYVLSASPSLIRSRLVDVLKKSDVVYSTLILRDNIFEDKFKYKVREIKKILRANQDDFIFIGDDLGDDPEVFSEIQRLYPGRVLISYVHVVNGRQVPSDVVPYWTSFDLFLREFLEGRMEGDQALAGATIIESEKNLKRVFPDHAQCPKTSGVWDWQMATPFQIEASRLIERLTFYCKQRQSDIFLQ